MVAFGTMADLTETDRRVAEEATGLLAERGRDDLQVSPYQVVRWYSNGAFADETGSGGRGQRRTYPPEAPGIAAELKIALDEQKSRDDRFAIAVLTALGKAPLAATAVRSAYSRAYDKVLGRLRLSTRPDAKRSERISFATHKKIGDNQAREALIAIAHGEEPEPEGTDLLIDRLFGEGMARALADEIPMRQLRQRLARVSIASLKAIANQAGMGQLVWATDLHRSIVEYVLALSEFVDATGTKGLDPVNALLGQLGRAIAKLKLNRDFLVAASAPLWIIVAHQPEEHVHYTRVAEDFRRATPVLQALTGLAYELPEHWRPVLGAASVFYMEQLPVGEQEALRERVRQWAEEHSDLARIWSDAAARGSQREETFEESKAPPAARQRRRELTTGDSSSHGHEESYPAEKPNN